MLILAITAMVFAQAFLIYWFFFRGPMRAGRFAQLKVPGETTAELPAGTVRLAYRVGIELSKEADQKLSVPEQLGLEVRPAAGGDPLPIDQARIPVQYRSLRHRTVQIQFGRVEVPAAGSYRVSAPRMVSDVVEPTLLLG